MLHLRNDVSTLWSRPSSHVETNHDALYGSELTDSKGLVGQCPFAVTCIATYRVALDFCLQLR